MMSTRNNSETKSTGADNSARPPLIELSGITKSFGNVDALSGVDLKIGEAESVGIIGDNGAGKSTLVKLLSGVYPATGGTMKFRGREVRFNSPLDARQNGIEMIYQDLALCEDLNVAQNIFLGREIKKNYGPILCWTIRP